MTSNLSAIPVSLLGQLLSFCSIKDSLRFTLLDKTISDKVFKCLHLYKGAGDVIKKMLQNFKLNQKMFDQEEDITESQFIPWAFAHGLDHLVETYDSVT